MSSKQKDPTEAFLCGMPKAELHLHIDGSLQAERMLQLARKNSISLPYTTVEAVEEAYNFNNLQSFLDLYYLGASVLRDEEDFYHLMMDYLTACRDQNVIHAEIMVEPQTYAPNGVALKTMMGGFEAAISEAKASWGQSTMMILSFLRHLSEEECLETLYAAEPYRESFVAIGLASSEMGHPPEKFQKLYAEARDRGYLAVAHAGEEGPPDYVWGALNLLKADRIDHGVRSVEDESLVEHLISEQVPLTVCPLSNIRLCVFDSMADHNILDMLDRGVCVTVNSDDPAYFGGYMNENFLALHRDLAMTPAQALQLSHNSFSASFASDASKESFIRQLDQYAPDVAT